MGKKPVLSILIENLNFNEKYVFRKIFDVFQKNF